MVYLIIFLTLVLLATLDVQENYKKLRTQCTFAMLVVLFFVAGFRYETGIDWLQYTQDFKDTKPLTLSYLGTIFTNLNPLFNLLMSSIKLMGGSVQTLFWVCQLIVFLSIWKAIDRLTEMKIAALLIYFSLLFFHLDMNLMKQAISVSIFFYSITYIKSGKLAKYSLYIFIGALFHWSILLFWPIYFVVKHRYSTLLLTILTSFFVLFYLLQLKTGDFVYNMSAMIFGEDSSITEKTEIYTSYSIYSVQRILSLGSLLNIIIISATIFYREKLSKIVDHFDIFLNLMVVQIFFYFFMYEYIELSGRLRFYTLISFMVILPYFVKLFANLYSKLVVYATIVVYCFSYSYIYVLGSEKTVSYNPYQNYLVHKIIDKRSNGKKRLQLYDKKFRKERTKEQKNK